MSLVSASSRNGGVCERCIVREANYPSDGVNVIVPSKSSCCLNLFLPRKQPPHNLTPTHSPPPASTIPSLQSPASPYSSKSSSSSLSVGIRILPFPGFDFFSGLDCGNPACVAFLFKEPLDGGFPVAVRCCCVPLLGVRVALLGFSISLTLSGIPPTSPTIPPLPRFSLSIACTSSAVKNLPPGPRGLRMAWLCRDSCRYGFLCFDVRRRASSSFCRATRRLSIRWNCLALT